MNNCVGAPKYSAIACLFILVMYMETQVRPIEMVECEGTVCGQCQFAKWIFLWKVHLLKQLIQSSFDLEFSKDT